MTMKASNQISKKSALPTKVSLISIAMVLLFALVTLGRRVWESYKYPVEMSELRRLKVGATETDVLRLFGVPQEMHGWRGDWRWCYYRSNRAGVIFVIFDAHKRYKGYEFED
jgi:hypothetical protein